MKKPAAEPYRDIDFSDAVRGPVIKPEPSQPQYGSVKARKGSTSGSASAIDGAISPGNASYQERRSEVFVSGEGNRGTYSPER